MIRAKLQREHLAQFRAQRFGSIGQPFKKLTRARFRTEVMEGFENQAADASRRGEPDNGGDDRAIAMAPEVSAFNLQRIEQAQRFCRRMVVEVGRKIVDDSRRCAVAAAIRTNNSEVTAQLLDLAVEGIQTVAPTAVQQNQRRSLAVVSVVNVYRTNTGRQRRSP